MAEFNKDAFIDRVSNVLRKEEGLRLKAYKPVQSEEFFTIGYGHYGKDVKEGSEISQEQAEELLSKDINSRISAISKKIPSFKGLNPDAQDAMFSSWYRGGLSGSPKTIGLINDGKFEEASKEFLNNNEYKSLKSSNKLRGVTERMERLSNQLSSLSKPKDFGTSEMLDAFSQPNLKELSEGLENLVQPVVEQQVEDKVFLNEKPESTLDTIDNTTQVESQEDTVDSSRLFIDADIGKDMLKTKDTSLDIEQLRSLPEPEVIEDNSVSSEPSRVPAGFLDEPLEGKEEDVLINDKKSTDELSTNPINSWGARPQEMNSLVGDLKAITLEGMGDDLINKFIDRNAVGFLMQAAIRNTTNTGKLDSNFNAFKDEENFKEMTKGLDNDQIKDILENTNNRVDFINNVSFAHGQNKRKEEMDTYTREHPVLSGVNSVTNMLAEGASFMPVASLVGSATAATEIKAISELAKSNQYARAFIGEGVEQGLQEIIWSKYDRDYEFDPIMFAGALGLGVGLKTAFGTDEADAAFRKFLSNEGGFINISTQEGKKLVDEVAKNTSSKQAIALAEKVTKQKVAVANILRKNLEARRSSLTRQLTQTTEAIKANKGNPEVLKKLKGKKQKLTRSITKFDKKLPNELLQLAQGTHPKLTARVNPQFKIKNIAKDMGIPEEHLKSVKSTRQFLGLDQPNVDPNFVFEGEKAYQEVARKQLKEMDGNRRLNMNESLKYAAGTDFVKSLDELPVLGKLQIGDKLNSLADTDGPISRMLFNKGNLVSSDNELVSSFYNWMAPDGMGRQGMSQIRSIESQQKYSNIFGGELMQAYHAHGNKIWKEIEGETLGKKVKGFLSPDEYERTVEPILKERLLSTDGKAFRAKYGNGVADAADDFYADFNKLNADIIARAKEVGVEGVDFDATEGWFHRSWDFRKARSADIKDLQDTVKRGMTSHAKKLGIEITDDVLTKNARKFAFGIRNADMTIIEGLQSDHIKLLDKLANKADGVEAKVIRSEIERLSNLKAKADAGDLANRVQMDVTAKLSDGRQLSDLFEDNVINTQKRYTSRMAARISAAEHGIKNIDDLDDWINDAVELEMKRLGNKGVKNPKEAVSHMRESMLQDARSFKFGGMSGLHDLQDDTASDFLRLVKKYNYARLMQYTGISSIAELGGTFVEAGVSNTMEEFAKTFRQHFNDLYIDNPSQYTNRLYDELRTITGVGMEDFSFSSKGLSKSGRITEVGMANQLEKGIDSIGRVTQGTFGGIETVGRRVTVNSLAIKWANHFTGNEKGGLLGAFFGSNGFSNRVLENSGFGTVDNLGKFTPNQIYNDIQSSIKKFASFDDNGRLTKLNLEKWNSSTAHSFGDALQMQSNHIMVNPDATTMALWQSSTVGQILNQFRTFTVNATTKVAGAALSNAAISSNRGDHSEMIKGVQKIFWGTSLGMLSVALRQGIQRAGGDREVDLFDEGIMKAAAIGFSRSSVAGNIPTIADSISGIFGIDPLFEKTSSIGRSKNFFNLATSPTGQAIGGMVKGVEKGLQGDVKGGGMQLLKTSPVYRQIGAQQIFNYLEKE